MEKVLIIASDNHGRDRHLKEMVARHETEADFFIHCGDSTFDYHDELMRRFVRVRGNHDRGSGYEEFKTLTIPAFGDVLVIHGHRDYVYVYTKMIVEKAKKMPNVRIVCYGHTHINDMKMVGDLLVLNPGSIEAPRDRRGLPTYIKLTIRAHHYEVELFRADDGRVIETRKFEKAVSSDNYRHSI
ncbi:MAG: YfcE family phosphodiesterase [Turicibacter sp.]|nr:YfcE family phosphodiesterase [Turicibacter sp.]